ncbi:hypothetical protein EAF04_010921 [Stromatinia cepivora]|nr:hypothetical protein EAF04_010921 [Stromatinia cepivora]
MMGSSFVEPGSADLEVLSRGLEEALSRLLKVGETVDMSLVLDGFFLDMSYRWAFGDCSSVVSEEGSLEPDHDIERFNAAFHSSQAWIGPRIIFGATARNIPNKRWKTTNQIVHDFVERRIDVAMKKISQSQTPEGGQESSKPTSLIESLVKQTDDQYEIRSLVLQGLLVIQDTTAITLSNALFHLSRHPSVWTRLRSEILQSKDSLTPSHLRRNVLLQNIIKETLRIHPVFANMARTALRDTILPIGGGPTGSSPIYVFAGSDVMTNFYTLHRNEAVYGKNVEEFNPDRWNRITPRRWEFMGFSGGARGCGGQQKALMEASYVLAMLAQRFERIESRDERDWAGDVKLIARNVNGCKVAFY